MGSKINTNETIVLGIIVVAIIYLIYRNGTSIKEAFENNNAENNGKDTKTQYEAQKENCDRINGELIPLGNDNYLCRTTPSSVVPGTDLNERSILSNDSSNKFPAPTDLFIENITDSSVEFSFNSPIIISEKNVVSYNLVVAEYNNPDGFSPSNNYTIHSFTPESINERCSDNVGEDTVNCRKTISLKMKDNNNKTVFYRLGLMAIYSDGSSNITTHHNISIFRLGVSVTKHLAILQNAMKEKEKPILELDDFEEKEGDEGSYTADGRFEMIKRQLGGYPDNLFIEEHTGPKSLDELVKRHLALGIMNINVHTNK